MTDADLVVKYRGLAYSLAQHYFLPGYDRQDVQQLALIALWQAARTWDGRIPFLPYAGLVIRRKLGQAVRDANQPKRRHRDGGYDVGLGLLEDTLADRGSVADVVEQRDTLRRLARVELSRLERGAVMGLASGRTYDELQAELGCSWRAVTNGAQRARAKLRRAA